MGQCDFERGSHRNISPPIECGAVRWRDEVCRTAAFRPSPAGAVNESRQAFVPGRFGYSRRRCAAAGAARQGRPRACRGQQRSNGFPPHNRAIRGATSPDLRRRPMHVAPPPCPGATGRARRASERDGSISVRGRAPARPALIARQKKVPSHWVVNAYAASLSQKRAATHAYTLLQVRPPCAATLLLVWIDRPIVKHC